MHRRYLPSDIEEPRNSGYRLSNWHGGNGVETKQEDKAFRCLSLYIVFETGEYFTHFNLCKI